MNAVCLEESDQDGLIDSLLAPCKGWPRYMMPTIDKISEASSSLLDKAAPSAGSKAGTSGHDGQQGEEQPAFRPDFALALGGNFGFELLVQPARGIPRSVYCVPGTSERTSSQPQCKGEVFGAQKFLVLFLP